MPWGLAALRIALVVDRRGRRDTRGVLPQPDRRGASAGLNLLWHRYGYLYDETAVYGASESPVRIWQGDAVVVLPAMLDAIPPDVPVCIFHTHTVNQFSPEARARFTALLARLATTRELFRLSAESLDGAIPQLTLTTWPRGHADERVLARCDYHGRWLEWLTRSEP